jgi:hypothetical protein
MILGFILLALAFSHSAVATREVSNEVVAPPTNHALSENQRRMIEAVRSKV